MAGSAIAGADWTALPREHVQAWPGAWDPIGGQQPVAAVERRVLIVEDEALVALTLEAMVEDMGHVVAGIAANPREALRLAHDAGPEVILMDVRLGRKGDEGIVTAAAIAAGSSASIIFVTAYGDQATMARIEAAVPGAQVLAKPVNVSDLAKAIKHAFRQP